jgi:hypothetical protein
MKKCAGALLGCIWVFAVLLRLQAAGASGTQAPSAAALVDFSGQIQPILESNCLECHSQDKRKGGLSLATYTDVLDGGRSGPAVRPGNGGGSLMFHRVTAQVEPQMPLDELPLSDEETALIRLWIDQGARPAPTAPPAPPPWEAPLALERPDVAPGVWTMWSQPVDRFVASYLSDHEAAEPALVSDAVFARRAYLDIWGLLPTPEALQGFVFDRNPDKRRELVARLLADNEKYAEHWISFWNDLLRNEDGVTYFSENNGRRSITDWLLGALTSNLPYDQFVTKLLNPSAPGDPDGFVIGVNWRGETSAAVTPWMQASQNTAQVFLGVNMKCNACHDSFVSRWKLKDAYALAAYFSPEPRLQLFRCDVARDEYAEPGFLYPELSRTPPSSSLADRRATAAAIFTDPRNGRMPRTLTNRIWERLLGHGIVPVSDEMDGKPWSPELLDWLASDFVEHGYDVKHLIATIMASRTYQMPAVTRSGEVPTRGYAFAGPEVRRMTAEQFGDAIGSITGEWSVYYPPNRSGSGGAPRAKAASDAVTAGFYGREWRTASTKLTRALGRPIRDQVTSVRATQGTTLQALELVNGELLTGWVSRGAKRMLGELPADPRSLFNGAVAGRYAAARPFDVDVSKASKLWLVVTDTGSNAPERIEPAWVQAEFVRANGTTVPLSAMKPLEGSGSRSSSAPDAARVRVKAPSRLVYDIAGRGFTRFRGTADVENPRTEIGSTLNPSLRFFVFDRAPNMDRLVPPNPTLPMPAGQVGTTVSQVVDRVFWHALNRAPSPVERRAAEAAITDSRRRGRVSADGLADLLWAILVKPEFQLIY